jgi:hypothetical protein
MVSMSAERNVDLVPVGRMPPAFVVLKGMHA